MLRVVDSAALAACGVVVTPGAIVPMLTGVADDSRRVKPGDIFVAVPGAKGDGAAYVDMAVANGAAAIVVPEGALVTAPNSGNVPVFFSANIRRSLALLARTVYPRQPETLVAVTGTNGKSSVVHFCQQLWQHAGLYSASLGTIGIQTSKRLEPGSLTTPGALSLMQTLDSLAAEGITHAALEASSHGLHQERLTGVSLKAAALLNITRDHLDYHGTMDEYAAAKLRLFGEVLAPGGAGVLNLASAYADAAKALISERGQRLITVNHRPADIQILKLTPRLHGMAIELKLFGEKVSAELPIVGGFQLDNMAAALGLVIGSGTAVNAAMAERLLPQLTAVKGRLELASPMDAPVAVYVDYAHTPDGLETALKALRPHTRGRLLVVFGCGGDRDPGKRPLMGQIAASNADVVLVTDDNPRSEDAALIRSAIVAAAPNAQNVGDRGLAIAAALNQAQPGDVILIAGKGHETGQIIGKTVVPFSDQETVRALFSSEAA
ncbi:MAG: UDP-N-acetylmuramoyl-L-alanyl-D-glutamate--2,6-diaminopimelate ligase [Alphaproteobacteria bacterium]|nr:UDP-N-acetylmuramoyl-L-alanyl-D-glutamate--2,6-diaminopimelate ligase [Alphaproteobacteria bacterium]